MAPGSRPEAPGASLEQSQGNELQLPIIPQILQMIRYVGIKVIMTIFFCLQNWLFSDCGGNVYRARISSCYYTRSSGSNWAKRGVMNNDFDIKAETVVVFLL